MNPNKLSGTGVAVITPFTAAGEVDHVALRAIIHFLVDSGIDFLVALGTTGESVPLLKLKKKPFLPHLSQPLMVKFLWLWDLVETIHKL